MLQQTGLLLLCLIGIQGAQLDCDERLDIITEDNWPVLQHFDRSLLDNAVLVVIGNVKSAGTYAVVHTADNRTYISGPAGYFHLDPALGGNVTREIMEIRGRKVNDIQIALTYIGILCEDGSFWTAGRNFFGQLGHHRTADRPIFSQVEGLPSVKQFAVTSYSVVVLTHSGQLISWGAGGVGQLGYFTKDRSNPVPRPINIAQVDKPMALCCGWGFCSALTKSGVLTWGISDFIGREGDNWFPGLVQGIPDEEMITKVVCGSQYAIALSSSGLLYGWGNSSGGALLRPSDSGVNATLIGLKWRIVRDVVAGVDNTIIRTYSPMAEYFGNFRGNDIGIPTPVTNYTLPRDALAESPTGQETWGSVRLNCTVSNHD